MHVTNSSTGAQVRCVWWQNVKMGPTATFELETPGRKPPPLYTRTSQNRKLRSLAKMHTHWNFCLLKCTNVRNLEIFSKLYRRFRMESRICKKNANRVYAKTWLAVASWEKIKTVLRSETVKRVFHLRWNVQLLNAKPRKVELGGGFFECATRLAE